MDIQSHLNIPSPLTPVTTSWSQASGISLFIKRDDLIHPLISGNKWRKLSGIFQYHKAAMYREVVTYGGAFSNHLVATAASCAILKIPCTGIVRGEEPKNDNQVLKLCRAYGMRLTYVTREVYKEVNRTNGVHNATLHIPEGGACEHGTIGCQDILKEVDLSNVAKVFVACGTGTTIAGMASYLNTISSKTKLCGIQVLKGEGYIAADLARDYNITNVKIYDQYHCGGYAKVSDELLAFIKEFVAETGVLLDPIYTGKMMLAIKKMCLAQDLKNGDKVMAIHTGGLTGWLGKAAWL